MKKWLVGLVVAVATVSQAQVTLRAACDGTKASISLENEFPVRGVQVEIQSLVSFGRPTCTARTTDWTCAYNAGKLLLVSLNGTTIAPGRGPIVEFQTVSGSGRMELFNPLVADMNKDPVGLITLQDGFCPFPPTTTIAPTPPPAPTTTIAPPGCILQGQQCKTNKACCSGKCRRLGFNKICR